jgi:hypothetical protein
MSASAAPAESVLDLMGPSPLGRNVPGQVKEDS